MNDKSKMNPEFRAREDYREGDGCQDSNPYDQKTQLDEHTRYAWEMHKIWNEDFTAELQLARSIEQEKRNNAKRI